MSIPAFKWMRSAACKGADLSQFFGPDFEKQAEREVREAEAKVVCAGCLVRPQCLSYAVTTGQKAGVWGGMAEDERANERRKYLRRQQRSAA